MNREKIKNLLDSLPVIGTLFNASEPTKEYEHETGLKIKEYAGDSAAEKLAEIDIGREEIRMVDPEWLHDQLLAHELAHWERFKQEKILNKIAGHFGNLVIYGGTFFLVALVMDKLGILHPTIYTWVVLPIIATVAAVGVGSKLIEEKMAEKMIPEMKDKYGLCENERNGEIDGK